MLRLSAVSKYLGLALISASVLALQVIFTRIFSIMIWHHFTYLVVGVALLGGGAAGTYLAVRHWSTATIANRLGKLAVGFSLSILLTLLLITQVKFDPLSFKDIGFTLFGLAVYFIALFITFFLGGLTIVGVFSVWVAKAHRLYFADLMGAGVSTLVVIWLVHIMSGPAAIILVALLALAAGFLFMPQGQSIWRYATLVIGLGQVALLFFTLVYPVQLPVPPSKPLNWALGLAGVDQPEYTRWNPVARVDVLPPVQVKEPMIVGGISSAYLNSLAYQQQEEYSLRLVTLDGTSMTGLYEFDGNLSRFEFLHHAIIAAPYQVTVERPTALNIGVGGGLDILLARLYNASQITAIDLNGDVINLLTGPYADYTGRLGDAPDIKLITAEGRSFLTSDNSQYDLIQGIGLDNVAALSSGAYVLSESYLYTVEAFELALSRLTPQGIFSWTRNTNNPPSEMLRLTGLAAEALRRQGVANPAQHIAVVANDTDTSATLLVSRAPFAASNIQRLRDWAASNQFMLLHDPLERLDTVYADYLYAPDPRAFEAAYVFNIFPVTDDHPFYYNYFKWTNLHFDQSYTGNLSKRFPVGNLILLTMLGFSIVTAAAFIIYPLWRYKRNGLQTPHTGATLTYFSALGLGYIFVEIVLIQRFTLFIGYPTYAITTTIFSMLSFSAVGSLISRRYCRTFQHLRLTLGLVTAMIFLYMIGLPFLFQALLYLPDTMRMLLSIVIIAPLGTVMGMPFPTGLHRLGLQAPSLVPWAWGMNGVFSVLGSVLVILVCMLSSFTVALAVAGLLYAVAAVASAALWKTQVVSVAVPVSAQKMDLALVGETLRPG